MRECEHAYENADCENCANGLPHVNCIIEDEAITQLREIVHDIAIDTNKKHFDEGFSKGREDAIYDALAILKSNHMARTFADDYDAKIEAPFYKKVYAEILKLREQKGTEKTCEEETFVD